MSILLIKRALEKHLVSGDTTPTGFEAEPFTPTDVLYRRCQIRVDYVDDPMFMTGYYRESLTFQVFVVAGLGQGAGEALEHAEALRSKFAKGLVLQEGNVRVYVLKTPQVDTGQVVEDRYIVPVLVRVLGETG